MSASRRPATAGKPKSPAPRPDEAELERRLEEQQAQLGCAADKLER